MKENVDPERATTQLLQTQCGTAKYMAPETIVRSGKGYNGEKVDAWECGMVLYALLAGYLPFNGEDDNSVFLSILRGKLKFPSHFSPGAKDVLRRLLEKDPAKRMTLPEVREHLWFLVDYEGDAVSQAATGTFKADTLVVNSQAESTPVSSTQTTKSSGSEKAKLGQHFKKNKSRSRLSQRIRQGALKVEAIAPPASHSIPEVKLVPQPPRNKSTVRFMRHRPKSDDAVCEEMVDIDNPKGDRNVEQKSYPKQGREDLIGSGDIVSGHNCHSTEEEYSEEKPPDSCPATRDISGDRALSENEYAGKNSVSQPTGTQSSKKPSRITTASNVLKVPSLGLFLSDSQRPLFSKCSGSQPEKDAVGIPSSSVDAEDEGTSSLRSRLKTPLSTMFKSMLSTSIDSQIPDAGMNGRLTAQSSWFASSPMSEAGSSSLTQTIDRMMSDDGVAESKVTSFKFLKRPKGSPRKRGDAVV